MGYILSRLTHAPPTAAPLPAALTTPPVGNPAPVTEAPPTLTVDSAVLPEDPPPTVPLPVAAPRRLSPGLLQRQNAAHTLSSALPPPDSREPRAPQSEVHPRLYRIISGRIQKPPHPARKMFSDSPSVTSYSRVIVHEITSHTFSKLFQKDKTQPRALKLSSPRDLWCFMSTLTNFGTSFALSCHAPRPGNTPIPYALRNFVQSLLPLDGEFILDPQTKGDVTADELAWQEKSCKERQKCGDLATGTLWGGHLETKGAMVTASGTGHRLRKEENMENTTLGYLHIRRSGKFASLHVQQQPHPSPTPQCTFPTPQRHPSCPAAYKPALTSRVTQYWRHSEPLDIFCNSSPPAQSWSQPELLAIFPSSSLPIPSAIIRGPTSPTEEASNQCLAAAPPENIQFDGTTAASTPKRRPQSPALSRAAARSQYPTTPGKWVQAGVRSVTPQPRQGHLQSPGRIESSPPVSLPMTPGKWIQGFCH